MAKKDANILGGFNLINAVNIYPFPTIVDGNKMINDEFNADVNSITKTNLINSDFLSGENLKLEKNKYYCLSEIINPQYQDMDITWAIIGVKELQGGSTTSKDTTYTNATLSDLAKQVEKVKEADDAGNNFTSKTEALFITSGIIRVLEGDFYLVAEFKKNIKNEDGTETYKNITFMYQNVAPTPSI